MKKQTVFMVGTGLEADHHISSFAEQFEIQLRPPDDVLTLANPSDLAIFFSEHFDRFRTCCVELKKRSVATLYLIDGILEWRNAWENRVDELACPWTMRPCLAHKVGCIGNSQARILASWGNAEKLEIVGIPRLDRLRDLKINLPNQNPKTFRVLIATAKFPGFTPEQIETTKRSLADLRDEVPRATADGRQIEVTWRLTGGLDRELSVENQLTDLSGRELSDQLASVDAVITTPSTTMLEAMLLSRPVALLDYHQTPQLTPAVWTISQRSQIARTVQELASPAEPKRLMQNHLLSDHLCCESATQRAGQLIRLMLQQSTDAVARGLPLTFPMQMLAAPGAEYDGFSHQTVYPKFAEFGNPDLVELQCELAHSRREIGHVQQQLAQAKAELSDAHQIFEQIQQHPIAGPIVRLRQVIRDKWSAFKKSPETEITPTKSDS